MQVRKYFKILLICLACFLAGSVSAQQKTVEELLEQVEFLTSNSRYEEALGIIDEAIKIDPKNAKIYFRKAEVLIGLGSFKEAVGVLEKAVQMKPDYTEAFEMLGNLYSQFRKAPQAVKNYEKAYQSDTAVDNRLRYKMEIINILFLVKRHKFAEPHIKMAKEIEPDNFDVKFMQVQYLNEVEQFTEAVTLMEELIKEVPETEGNERYFFEMGLAYHMTGKYAKAQQMFAKITDGPEMSKIKQFLPETYYSIAMAYFSVYAFDRCDQYVDIAIAIKPDYKEAFELKQKLVGVKTPKGAFIKAKEELIKIEKDPKNLAELYKGLAELQYQGGLYQECKASCDETLAINEKQIIVVFLKAMCEYKLQQADDATAMLDKVVKNPQMPGGMKAQFHFARGLIYRASGNLDAAESAFKSAYSGNYRAAARNELTIIFKTKMLGEKNVEDIKEDGGGDEGEGEGEGGGEGEGEAAGGGKK